MRYLLKGGESDVRFKMILGLTRIASPDVREALRDHLVKGFSEGNAAQLNGVKPGNFERALQRMEVVAKKLEELKEHDWAHFNYKRPAQLSDK